MMIVLLWYRYSCVVDFPRMEVKVYKNKNPPSLQVGYQAKDGSTYPYTAYLGAETLYIQI